MARGKHGKAHLKAQIGREARRITGPLDLSGDAASIHAERARIGEAVDQVMEEGKPVDGVKFNRILQEGGKITFEDGSPPMQIQPGTTPEELDRRLKAVQSAAPEQLHNALDFLATARRSYPWEGERLRKAQAMVTMTSTHRPEPYRKVEPPSPDVLAKAYLHQLKDELEQDEALMEKVRANGVKLGFNLMEGRKRAQPNALRDDLKRKWQALPLRYTRAMARPSGLPLTRQTLITHLQIEQEIGRGPLPWGLAPEHDWPMYFATADFTDLFHEMQHDFTGERIQEYMGDVMEEWGPNGQVVIGFDLLRLPIVRVSKTVRDSITAEGVPPDPTVFSVEGDPDDRMRLGALAFMWRTHESGATEVYCGLHSAGDTLRTSVAGSPSTRDAILIAWMLSSRALRMLEAREQTVTAGMPPKAKKAVRKTVRDDKVTVVTLRRHVKAQVGQVKAASAGSGRHLQHRFVVRGHWRNQAYGTKRALRRRTYILPFVKGPADAPFMERERVYQW